MLPMDAAPRAGVVPSLPETSPGMRAKLLDVWEEAQSLARDYWTRIKEDARISTEFRRMAERHTRA